MNARFTGNPIIENAKEQLIVSMDTGIISYEVQETVKSIIARVKEIAEA